MPNPFFRFKQFTIYHDRCSMKVTTDACLFGAWAAENNRNLDASANILDIGGGSGLLSLMMAQQTDAFIESVEIQGNDYLQCTTNITNSPFRNRVTVYHADALQFQYNKKYKAIVSNPPFYEKDLKSSTQGKNIAHHDEALQLSNLLELITRQLAPDGYFYLLLPEKRRKYLEALLLESQLFANEILQVYQTENHSAFRVMVRGSFRETQLSTQKILIKEGANYSAAFTRLLRDYYLYL